MWRALIFVGLLAVAAFAAVWLADRPGEVLVTWNGYQAQTSVAVGAVLLVTIALLLALLWSIVTFLLRLPGRVGQGSRNRRRVRGFHAISRGMVAVGAGDAAAARRHAGEAQRLVGEEPLALLLTAQSAQAAGDRPGAERAFRRMTEHPETRVLGLRGLFVEARRRGDPQAARAHAHEAARIAPAVSWASDAMLEGYSAEGDWRAAIAAVERRASLGLVERAASRRQRAVLHAADALSRAEGEREAALNAALAAVKLAPDLVPAAALAGRILAEKGDLRRAAKIIETAWRANPHPDLARAYLDLRPGDAAQDRLRRAETLARLSSWEPESRLALARAALDAREFRKARDTLQPLLAERPTMRVALLMAELEQAENGAAARVREWLARATRAPRDKAWIADGLVSERWAPVSPVTGRLDAFVWEAPPDLIGTASGSIEPGFPVKDWSDEPVAALEGPAPPAAISADTMQGDLAEWSRVPAEAAPSPPLVVQPAEIAGADTAPPSTEAAPTAPLPPAATIPPDAPVVTPAPDPAATPTAAAEVRSEAAPAAQADGTRPALARPEAVIFPVAHAPDDPGPEDPAAKRSRFRLLG